MSKKGITPIVVTGAKRSGTTLMQCLLDATPGTFNFLSEAYFFEYLYDIGGENIELFIDVQRTSDIDDLVESTRARLLFPFFERGFVQEHGTVNVQRMDIAFDIKKVKEGLREGQKKIDGTIESVWNMWLGSFMKGMGCDGDNISASIFKSGVWGKSAVTSLRYLKDARAIAIVRDPVFAIDSLKRSREINGENLLHLYELLNAVRGYRLFKKNMEGIFNGPDRDRIMLIKYEELVSGPEKIMREAARFLGLDYDDIMVRPTVSGRDWHGFSSFQKFNGISKASAKRGIITLSDWEVDYINRGLDEFKEFFGYRGRKWRAHE